METVRAHMSSADGSEARIDEAFVRRTNEERSGGEPQQWEDNPYRPFCLRLDQCLDDTELWRCLTAYFAVWHPLFPFLDGRTAQSDLQEALNGRATHTDSRRDALAFRMDDDALRLTKTVVLTSIVSISRIGHARSSASLPEFQSTRQATNMAYMVIDACDHSSVNNLLAVQALVAVDLFLYASHKIRQAFHLSGIILRESTYWSEGFADG